MTDYLANFALPDLNQCEAEPIQIPGSIQPHGVLLALYGATLRITQVSDNCQTWLGIAPSALLEQELATVLGEALANAVHFALVRDHEQPAAPAAFHWQAPSGMQLFNGHIHHADALTILELEPVLADAPYLRDILIQAVRGFEALQRQAELPVRLQTAAALFRQLTGYDRVMIYRFDADDWHGEVLAEARRADLEPYLGLHFPASDIPAQARELYLRSPTRVIVDIDYMASPLVPVLNPITAQPLDLSLSQLRSVSPVHLEYLRNMGVRATLTASLLNAGQLWGLIACHHMTPCQLTGDVREVVAWMARDLSDQIMLLEEQQRQHHAAQLKHCRDHIIAAMRDGRRLAELLQAPDLTMVLGAVAADGVAVIHNGKVSTGGVTPAPAQILDLVNRLTAQHGTAADPLFATACLSAELDGTEQLVDSAAGVVIFPVDAAQPLKLMWFRDEQLRHVTWGGNPDKAINVEPDGRISPRQSFAAWRQTVKAHSRRWSRIELESARELGALLDIEWRRVAEEAQRAQEGLLKDVLNSLTAHIAVLDHRGVILLVNANWQRFADENGGDVSCQPGVNYLTVCNRVMSGQDGVDAQAALQGIQQVLARTQDSFHLIYPCDSPTEQRWFEMRVLPLSGAQLGAVIAHEDITTQMLAQRALQASEQRLQRVLDGSNDGFWDWNVATGEQQVNRRWAEMLRYTLDEIAPSVKSWEQRVHPDDLPACLAAVQAHFSGVTPYYQSEHRLRTKDGGWCWILARGRVTARDAKGQPTWMAGTHTDITERRVMEEQLRVSLAELKRHDAQMSALNHMNDLLLSCLTREEAYPIIAQGAAALFADMFGTLAVIAVDDAAKDELRCVAVWGDAAAWLPSTFSPQECWALRRGKLHEVTADGDALACQHFLDQTPPTFFCVPLTVRGTTLGLLHIGSHTALDANRFRELRTLAIAVSESIKLALSNLQFQETLRDLPKAQSE